MHDISEFKPGLYRHYKGGQYRALHLAVHHETEEIFVVYVSLSNGSVRLREWDSPGKDSWTDTVEFRSEDGSKVSGPRFIQIES